MNGIGLALGSGGARGWCHIGVIRALQEMEVRPGVVAGCSMGALVGAAYAGGRLDALETWARGLTRSSFFRLLDVRLWGGGLVGGGEILTVLEELGLPDRVEDLPVPFAAIATDMSTGEEVWLREGPLAEVVRASVALPGVISPYRHGDQWLLDGGLVNPVPVSAARALGAAKVIAVNPNARDHGGFWSPEDDEDSSELAQRWAALMPKLPSGLRELLSKPEASPSYLDVVTNALNIMIDRLRRARLQDEPPDVMLDALLSDMLVLEFYRAAEAIDEGRRITRVKSDEIREMMA